MNHKLREMYALNESFEEKVVKKKHKKLYKAIIDKYGNWEKAMKLHGVTKKRLKERSKFQLYHIMKNRYDNYGSEALRPKNIKDGLKEEIVEVYSTIKNLKRSLFQWDEDKVMYELRAYILSGGKVEEIQKGNVALSTKINDVFGGIEEVKDEYIGRFGLKRFKADTAPSVFDGMIADDEHEEKTETVVTPMKDYKKQKDVVEKVEVEELGGLFDLAKIDGYEMLDMLVKAGELSKDTANNFKEIGQKTDKEIASFLMREILEAQSKGMKLTAKKIQEKDETMFYAITQKYGNLQKAIRNMTENMLALMQ